MPSNSILFPSLDEVVEIDSVLIERFGGAKGIRDLGLLESALYRPQTGYYDSLAEMAAAMFESLIKTILLLTGINAWRFLPRMFFYE